MSGPIRTAFCGIDTVSCVVGRSVPQVYDLVESGRFLWVWNVSSGVGARRERRFWSREINDPASVANFTLDTVIKSVLPDRSHLPGQRNGLHNWEFRHLLRLSKPTVCELRKELGIRGTIRHLFIPRTRLEQFFRKRWIGNIHYRHPGESSPQKKPKQIGTSLSAAASAKAKGRRKKSPLNSVRIKSKRRNQRLKKKK
jgi:hypothetical protein